MDHYDSNSSGNEDEELAETNVLLGYASKEPTDDAFSQLGGFPSWLNPENPPLMSLAKCKSCNTVMALLLQLNGDLPDHFPGHERRLYIFTCRGKSCRRREGSIRALRGVNLEPLQHQQAPKLENSPPPQKQETAASQVNLGTALFGMGASPAGIPINPFSSNSSSLTHNPNPFSSSSNPTTIKSTPPPNPPDPTTTPPTAPLHETFSSALKLSLPPTPPINQNPWPALFVSSPPFPSYHLDADYESVSNPPSPPTRATPLESSTLSEKDDPATYESPLDSVFQRFASRLAQNPLQVLRYEFRGHPLLYSKSDSVGVQLSRHSSHARVTVQRAQFPACASCGAERVFEMQLTPQAIAELEAEETAGFGEGLEWGTVIVGVCSKDCVPRDAGPGGGYLEEWVGVQWEEEVGAGGAARR
ncbi:MAG: hypothetical protein M1829_002531 [Trizodia sp. TS-e1964]|nr:MAG: hypothetical protein M1829_002531 [Trizodia sp. TS-e1964]